MPISKPLWNGCYHSNHATCIVLRLSQHRNVLAFFIRPLCGNVLSQLLQDMESTREPSETQNL